MAKVMVNYRGPLTWTRRVSVEGVSRAYRNTGAVSPSETASCFDDESCEQADAGSLSKSLG